VSDDGEESRCCEIDDARAIADAIGIPFYVKNCVDDFAKCVIRPFTESYVNGLTPNPCIVCNRYIKWDKLTEMAGVLDAAYIATGHYASTVRLDNGRFSVKRALHAEKDQTYMLYMLTQDMLGRTMMPLSDLSKDEVRQIAKDAGIPVFDKPDSQEICFVPDDDHVRFITENYDGVIPGEGNFVDESGNVLGTHSGIINYTVGQRKGLGIAFGHPMYVKSIDSVKNEVVLAEDESLYVRNVRCCDVNMMGIEAIREGGTKRCRAKIRYRHEAQSASAHMENEELVITFDDPVRAASPGQSAVMYDDNGCVIGGGVIRKGI
jgi:tRNA-specific 2-thiouridylase